MKVKLLILLTALLSISLPSQDLNKLFEKFQLTTFKGFQRIEGSKGTLTDNVNIYIDARTPRLVFVGKYSGIFRETPKERYNSILTFESASVNFKGISNYKHEIGIIDQDELYWIQVVNNDFEMIKKLKKGQEITIFTTYIGCCLNKTNDRIYLSYLITDKIERKIERNKCFTQSLIDFNIGMSFKEANKIAKKKYGEPIESFNIKGEQYFRYIIDSKFNTSLYLASAGFDYSNYLYLIQISGSENPNFVIFKNIKLGSSINELKKMLQNTIIQSNDNYDLIFEKNSSCSFAVSKKGNLKSVVITDDPNFFRTK